MKTRKGIISYAPFEVAYSPVRHPSIKAAVLMS